jgi:hypothetical protein
MFSLNPALSLMHSLLAENLAKFPTNDDCLSELKKYFDEKCNHCQGKNLMREIGCRYARCLSCNKKTWVTARTFFHSIKKPRAYLMAFTLIKHGIEFSGAAFGRLVGIESSSAQHIIKKISMVLIPHLENHGPDTKSSDFAPCVFRRSVDTPANKHPHAEFDELEQRIAAQSNQIQNKLNTLNQIEQDIYRLFDDQPISLTALELKSELKTNQILSALAMLEIEGLIETTSRSEYVKCKQVVTAVPVKKPSRLIRKHVAKSMRDIRRTHRNVSRKYLQLYLAFNWCLLDKKWDIDSLLRACEAHGPVSETSIKQYASPYMVHVCRFV